jgi:hypothetical protein
MSSRGCRETLAEIYNWFTEGFDTADEGCQGPARPTTPLIQARTGRSGGAFRDQSPPSISARGEKEIRLFLIVPLTDTETPHKSPHGSVVPRTLMVREKGVNRRYFWKSDVRLDS